MVRGCRLDAILGVADNAAWWAPSGVLLSIHRGLARELIGQRPASALRGYGLGRLEPSQLIDGQVAAHELPRLDLA